MIGMVPDPRVQRRVYLTLAPGLDGKVMLQASYAQPRAGVCAILLNSRGMLAGDPMTIPLVSLPPPAVPAFVEIGTVTIREQATIQISAGVRTVTLAMAAVAKGDRLLLFPVDPLPAGYLIQTAAVASAAGVLKATVIAPVLLVNAKYEIPVRVVRIA